MDELQRVKKMYETRYRIDWKDRSYMWHPRNPISFVHNQILDRQIFHAINHLKIELLDQKILDIGSGYGRLLRFWTEMGADSMNLFGIDITFYRLQHASSILARAGFTCSSAGELPFGENTFDILSQFSTFSSIFDHGLRRKAAREMVRVLRPSGWLIWYDISFAKGGSPQPITRNDAMALFPDLDMKYCVPIFSRELTRIIRFNVNLAYLWERLPFIPKNSLVMVFRHKS